MKDRIANLLNHSFNIGSAQFLSIIPYILQSSDFAEALCIRLGKEESFLVKANLFAFQKNYASALENYINCLRINNKNKYARENLGYILFHCCDYEVQKKVLDLLKYHSLIDVPELKMIILSLYLSLDEKKSEGEIKSFLNSFVFPSIVNTSKKPIFFWHIPKCGGTSINDLFWRYFYSKAEEYIWPSYSAKPLLRYLIQNYYDFYPYMPSAHCSKEELKVPDGVYSFSVFRDPYSRLLSMFRQSREAFTKGWMFKQFPSYGFHWDKWKAKDLVGWLEVVPEGLLLRQLSTFSESLDVNIAALNIKKLDYLINQDSKEKSYNILFRSLDLPLEQSMMSNDLNASPKTYSLNDDEKELAKNLLQREYNLLSDIFSE